MEKVLRILIMEDNPNDAVLVQFELEEAGIAFTAKVVMTEKDFIHELQEFSPDMILSDYDLPQYNGALALAEARKRCPDCPFILVTGAVSEERAIEILTSGAKDYVMKNRLNRLGPAVRRAFAEAGEHRARKKAEENLRKAHRELEAKVKKRTAALEAEMTERKKIEEALLESRQRYRDLVANANSIIINMDQKGTITFFNEYAQKFFGYALDEILGKNVRILVPQTEINGKNLEEMADNILRNPDEYPENINESLRKNGERVWVSWRNKAIRDSNGNIIGNLAIGNDITEAKRAQAEIAHMASFPMQDPNPITEVDLTGVIHFMNPAAEKLFPDLRRLGPAHPWLAAWEDTLPNLFKKSMEQKSREVKIGENWFGQMMYFVEENQRIRIYGRPITKRKRTEQALRESEMLYHSMFKNMLDGFAYCKMLFDAQGNPEDFVYIAVNDAFGKLTGLENVAGKKVTDAIPGIKASNPELFEIYGRVVMKGRPERFEINFRPLNKWLSVSAYQTKGEYFVVIFEDITERKRLEETQVFLATCNSAVSSKDFFESLSHYLAEALETDYVCIDRLEGDCLSARTVAVYFDGKFEDNVTYTLKDTPCGDVVGKMICTFPSAVRHLFPRDVVLQEMMAESYAGTTLWSTQGQPIGLIALLWRKPLANPRIVESVLKLVSMRAAGELERMTAEEELIKRATQLDALNKELESFSYSVSHDLRAPLRAIDGYSKMILKKQGDKFDEGTKWQFDRLRSSTKAMGQLIDDILAFSRLGKQALNIKALDLCQLIEEAWPELQNAYPDRNMTLKIDPMPPGWGDRNLMKQVFVNLLSNAVKFTKTRDIALIEAGGHENEKELVCYVKDNGVGFDMKYHDKLFGVFQRLHGADEYEGTGIGLALVQRIIHRHGGRVWAEGRVDEGASFYFTLPGKE